MNHMFCIITGIILCIRPVFSQHCIQGVVRDKDNNPVSFATIGNLSGQGTICDSAGSFEFCFPYDAPKILVVGALGYSKDTLVISDKRERLEIRLNQIEFKLDEVFVIHRQNIKEKSMVSSISTDKKEMAMLNPQNIGEVLQNKTGFTNRSGYQAPLTLRGMSGKRLLILRNGLRRFSSYPAGYMSHTINVYDLERIEVEKGAASVVYGAGAMAGIVNLIDKSPFKQDGLNAKLTTGYGSINNEKNLLACGGWSDGKLAVKTGLRYRTAGNFRYPDGTVAENSFYTDKDLFASFGYKLSVKQALIFATDMHNGGPWGKPVGFNGSGYMQVQTRNENTYNFAMHYSLQTLGLLKTLEISTFFSNEKRELVKNYYTAAGYMLSYVETTKFSDYYNGARLKGKLQLAPGYFITAGAESYGFHISTPTDAVDYISGISFQNRVSHNARSYITGTFMENTYTPGNRLKLVAGIRYDYASVYEGDVYSINQEKEMNTAKSAFSGNIAALWRMGKSSKIKINTARSFRMPETTEMYADSYTPNGILYGNPGLKPEYSYSLDICYSYTSPLIEIEISPFIWFIDDMISKEEIKGMPGTNYQYANIGKSRILGGEITTEIPFTNLISVNDKLSVSLGAAWLNGTDVSASRDFFARGIPLDYVPPFNLKTEIMYNSTTEKRVEYNIAFRTIYYSEQTRLGEKKFATPSYFLLGFSAGLGFREIKTRPSINIAVNNLLNTEYYSYLSYLPGEGRDVRVFLTFYLD